MPQYFNVAGLAFDEWRKKEERREKESEPGWRVIPAECAGSRSRNLALDARKRPPSKPGLGMWCRAQACINSRSAGNTRATTKMKERGQGVGAYCIG